MLTKVLQEEDKEEERAKNKAGDQRAWWQSSEWALHWYGFRLLLIRWKHYPFDGSTLRKSDASPRGIGGVLIHKVGGSWHMMEAFRRPCTTTPRSGIARLRTKHKGDRW